MTPDQAKQAVTPTRVTVTAVTALLLAQPTGGITVSTPRERLTVDEFCAEMKISRSTFYDWKAKGRAPRCYQLPNRELRIDRADIEQWFRSHEVAA
jgi:excisionase family DNA binding protein